MGTPKGENSCPLTSLGSITVSADDAYLPGPLQIQPYWGVKAGE